MAGRGYAARSAGRGQLLEKLGVEKGDLLPLKTQAPSPTFPPLQFRPLEIPMERDITQSYRLMVKKEFREHMRNSDYYIQPDTKIAEVDRYSDRYQTLANNKNNLSFHWLQIPKELHPISVSRSPSKHKRKLVVAPNVNKRAKTKEVNVKEKLEELEKKEIDLHNKPNEDKEELEIAEEFEDDSDEEMDKGTDYVNSHFDNGDGYMDDDDDGLEEGGVF